MCVLVFGRRVCMYAYVHVYREEAVFHVPQRQEYCCSIQLQNTAHTPRVHCCPCGQPHPEECNEKLDKGGVVHLCEVEQDLVMKVNGKGEPLKNPSALVYDILFPKSKGEASAETVYSNYDKFRVLALYILYNNGKPLPRAVLCSPCDKVQYVRVCLTHWPPPPGVPNEDFRKFSEYANLPKELRYMELGTT